MTDGFIAFGNLDDMARYMADAEKVANENTLPRQKTITYGDYWLKADHDIFVFGRVLTEDEYTEGITTKKGRKEALDALHERYDRGYRRCKTYSLFVPEGELGDSHVATMWPITQEEFVYARKAGWAHVDEDWMLNMLIRVQREVNADASGNDSPPSTGSPQETS